MRIHIGSPQLSRTFDPSSLGWKPVSGLKSAHYVWLALVIGLPCFLGSLIVLYHSISDWKKGVLSQPGGRVLLFTCLLLMVPVHELIHALAYRCGLRSPHLILGIWPRRFLIYVLYDAPLPKARVLRMLAAPLVTLTFLPLGLLLFLQGDLASLTTYFILVHTSACSGDIITWIRFWKQVPPNALIHNQGETTYWGHALGEASSPGEKLE